MPVLDLPAKLTCMKRSSQSLATSLPCRYRASHAPKELPAPRLTVPGRYCEEAGRRGGELVG